MKPLVSIIIPVFNKKKYFPRCIESVLSQSLKEIEIVIVDDGSVDGTGAICQEYAEKDKRIVLLRQENEGAGMARNRGIWAASGEYIAFVDADDYVKPDMYELLYAEACRKPVDMVCCDYTFCDRHLKSYPIISFGERMEFGREELRSRLLLSMIGAPSHEKLDIPYQVSIWKALYKRETLLKCSEWFPSERVMISEEMLFHIRFFEYAQNAVYLPAAPYFYCENEDSLTATYDAERFLMEENYYLQMQEYLKLFFTAEQYLQRWKRNCIGRIRRCVKAEFLRQNSSESCEVRVKRIMNSTIVQQMFEDYDDRGNPLYMRLFNLFFRRKSYLGMRILYAKVRLEHLNKH